MFSKFDINIQSEELAPVEPTQADWEEYHAWLEEQEAGEEFQLSAPKGWDVIEADDSIGELDTNGFDDELEALYGVEYPSEPWDDDYTDYDPVDMYAAEWENYAMRDWD